MVPAGAPIARLVRGSEIYVAPRLRLRPSDAAAAGSLLPKPAAAAAQQHGSNGKLAGQGGQPSGAVMEHEEAGDEDAATPLSTVLRVQELSSRAASSLQPSAAAARASLPLGVGLVGAGPATLARCGLRPGDWVRLGGRASRSLVKFACLAATELAAPGHLALTAEQSEWAGAPPFSHVRLQRLTRGQRQLITEAAELQASSGSRTTGSSRATLGGMLQGHSPTAAAAAADPAGAGASSGTVQPTNHSQEQDGAAAGVGGAALAESGWLRPAAEQVLQHLLPVLGFAPRSLLQSWGAPRTGGLLVCGPAGSGKSALLAAAADMLQRHPQCLTYRVTLSCRDISAEGASQVQAQILPKVRSGVRGGMSWGHGSGKLQHRR